MDLFDFQKEGISFLKDTSSTVRFLFDDMGLGKTVQACVAAEELGYPILVVSPQSPVVVWEDHLTRLTSKEPKVIARPLDFRWPKSGEAVIGTYAQLSWLTYQAKKGEKRAPNQEAKRVITDFARGPKQPTILIFDEAHALKGFSGRAIQGRNLSEACLSHGGFVWMLTGTPVPCSPLDLWGLLSVVGYENYVFQNFQHFLTHFGGREIRWESSTQEVTNLARKYGYTYAHVLSCKNYLESPLNALQIAYETKLDVTFVSAWRTLQQHLKNRTRQQGGKRYVWSEHPPGGSVLPLFRGTVLRRLRSQVLTELPPIIHRVLPIPVADLPKFTRDKANEAVRLLEQRTGHTIEKVTSSGLAAYLKDVVAQEQLFSALKLLAETKIPFLMDLVGEHEDAYNATTKDLAPLAVCSEYRKPIECLARRPKWEAILGGDGLAARRSAMEALASGKSYGIGFTGAGEEGLTLTTCHRLVKVSSSLSPSREEQREARVHRHGQTRGVIIDHLVVNHPLDTLALRIGATKSTIAKEALDSPIV